MQHGPFIGYSSSPGFCALFEGDLDFLAGGRLLARNLKLCLWFGGSELHACTAPGSANLGQEVPVPRVQKHEFPAFVARIVSLAKRERGDTGRGVADHDHSSHVCERDAVAASRQLRASYVEG